MLAEKRVDIVEVGPRDGLQGEPVVLPTATKVEFIERAIAAGVRRIEVTSFVNPKRVPQMADAEAVLQALPRRDGVYYIGLVLNRKGFERAAAAGCNEIGMAVVASNTFNERNQGVTTEESIAAWLDIAAAAKAAGIRPQVTVSAAFGCPFEGEVPAARVVEIARRVAEAG
jgi:hydroxymethylglutaryl-CoA lyase